METSMMTHEEVIANIANLELSIPDDLPLVTEQFCSTSRDWCEDSELQSITSKNFVFLVHNAYACVGVLPVGHTCDLRRPGNLIDRPGDVLNTCTDGLVFSDKLKGQLIEQTDEQLDALSASLEARKRVNNPETVNA